MSKCNFVHTANGWRATGAVHINFICTKCGTARYKRLIEPTEQEIQQAVNSPMVNINCEVKA